MQHLAVQRCTACGSWWGEMELWRPPGSQLPMKMSDHFGAIINAIMHFKIYWCNNVFQKYQLSVMHFRYYRWNYAFQQSSMQLCISTMVPWLAVYSLQIAVPGHQGQSMMIFSSILFQKLVAGHIFPSAERIIYLIYQSEFFTWFTSQSFILGRRLSYHHFFIRFTAPEKGK